MDSIVKNVGGEYSSLFTKHLDSTVAQAFLVADNKTRQVIIEIFNEWQRKNVFQPQETQLIKGLLAHILQIDTISKRAAVSSSTLVSSKISRIILHH